MPTQRREQLDERVARHLRDERARRIQDVNDAGTLGCRMFSLAGVGPFTADGTPQVVAFDDPAGYVGEATVYDTAAIFDVANPTRFVVPATGIYLAIFRGLWAAPNEDVRYASFTTAYRAAAAVGVVAEWELSAAVGVGGAIRSVASGTALLEAGDELETEVRANGVSNATVSPCSFDLVRL